MTCLYLHYDLSIFSLSGLFNNLCKHKTFCHTSLIIGEPCVINLIHPTLIQQKFNIKTVNVTFTKKKVR